MCFALPKLVILSQNSETITSLEFVNCKLSSSFIDAICYSLFLKGKQSHGVKQFTIQASKFIDANMNSLPDKFVSFLSSERSLSSLSLCDNHLQRSFAKLALKTLLDASSNLSSLDLSENNPQFSLEISKSLRSLRVLNLRGNNLHKNDAEDLKFALVHMPVLETLDLSDNPIGDGGIKLVGCLTGEHYSLANLNLKNCMLSCDGVTELLEVLTKLKYTLTSLSIAKTELNFTTAKRLLIEYWQLRWGWRAAESSGAKDLYFLGLVKQSNRCMSGVCIIYHLRFVLSSLGLDPI
ncbi:hypothetical protein Ancab_031906 [Ancistrocladus abbreviatus]